MSVTLPNIAMAGYRIDRVSVKTAHVTGDALSRVADYLDRRQGIVDVRFKLLDGDSAVPFFLAYAERQGLRPDLGYIVRPDTEAAEGTDQAAPDPIVSKLCSVLSRLSVLSDFPSALFAEVALALRAAHGTAHSPLVGLRERGLATVKSEMAMRFITENLVSEFDPKALADACGMTPRELTRAFRVTHGLSPLNWRRWQRIERAKGYLADTSRPLGEIAAACGFSGLVQFVRTFTSFEGISPLAWRRTVPVSAPADRPRLLPLRAAPCLPVAVARGRCPE
jgi:AraC-like DNA-binding protein